VYNDVTAGPHASGASGMGLEIRGLAYAYGPCSVSTGNPVLNYTTFYEYTIINRSANTYTDFSIGIHTEADLGQYNDDYIGCDVTDGYGYVYNGDANDETAGGAIGYGTNPPAAAFVLLKTPEAMNDGIDNDHDGVIDEAGEQMGMTNFMYYANPLPGTPAALQAPANAVEYHHYLNSRWKDGSPLSCNAGNGYGGSTATHYAYPGTTYTTAACTAAWSETAAPGDRRYVLSTKSYSLQPGEVIRFEFAHVTSFSQTGNVLNKLDQDVNAVKNFYQSGAGTSCLATGLYEETTPGLFSLYPVPAGSSVQIDLGKPLDAIVELYDLYGKLVLQSNIDRLQTKSLDLTGLAVGTYIVKVRSEGGSFTKKLVKYND